VFQGMHAPFQSFKAGFKVCAELIDCAGKIVHRFHPILSRPCGV
jgi:hypothetical protein